MSRKSFKKLFHCRKFKNDCHVKKGHQQHKTKQIIKLKNQQKINKIKKIIKGKIEKTCKT